MKVSEFIAFIQVVAQEKNLNLSDVKLEVIVEKENQDTFEIKFLPEEIINVSIHAEENTVMFPERKTNKELTVRIHIEQ